MSSPKYYVFNNLKKKKNTDEDPPKKMLKSPQMIIDKRPYLKTAACMLKLQFLGLYSGV